LSTWLLAIKLKVFKEASGDGTDGIEITRHLESS